MVRALSEGIFDFLSRSLDFLCAVFVTDVAKKICRDARTRTFSQFSAFSDARRIAHPKQTGTCRDEFAIRFQLEVKTRVAEVARELRFTRRGGFPTSCTKMSSLPHVLVDRGHGQMSPSWCRPGETGHGKGHIKPRQGS